MKTKIFIITIFSFIFFSIWPIVNYANTNENTYEIYNGTMYIDYPTENIIWKKSETTKYRVEGWAVSTDENARVDMYVDGELIEENLKRKVRNGVNQKISPQYGGIEKTPQAGFITEIDINNFNSGIHKLKIVEISRYGDIISQLEKNFIIENEKYYGTMYLDYPSSNMLLKKSENTKYRVEGWAVSTDEKAKINMYVDGNLIQENLERKVRKGVDQKISPQYGGIEKTPQAGFITQLDISNLSEGKHILKIEEISRNGDIIEAIQTEFRVMNERYSGTMNLESPESNEKYTKNDKKINLFVNGWAVSTDENAKIKVLIDRKEINCDIIRYKREDVDRFISPQYGITTQTLNAGYMVEIDISEYDIGKHNLKIDQISQYGDTISTYERSFYIEKEMYSGQMWIDNPTSTSLYANNKLMIVKGWAVSTDEKASIEIYIDNKFICYGDRYYRKDIENYMKIYEGKTINAGYMNTFTLNDLSNGTHKVIVYQKSRYGDTISQKEINFYINNGSSNSSNSNNSSNNNALVNKSISTKILSGMNGIDVSEHQGVINWKSVAESGIKYAMIRAGYRGYGNGKLVEDSKFVYNVRNAVANGIKVGLYFYSPSINTNEAKEDAYYVINLIKKYGFQFSITMPIAIDLELVSGVKTRDIKVSKTVRTNIANTFCKIISIHNLTPMIYACTSFLNNNMFSNKINYDVWVAQYNSKCYYSGKYSMWQYTSQGKINGINGNVDYNIIYKTY